MEQLWFLAVLLVCPLVMGGMMLWMRRETRAGHAARETREETRE